MPSILHSQYLHAWHLVVNKRTEHQLHLKTLEKSHGIWQYHLIFILCKVYRPFNCIVLTTFNVVKGRHMSPN
jgi:hypothetical protein